MAFVDSEPVILDEISQDISYKIWNEGFMVLSPCAGQSAGLLCSLLGTTFYQKCRSCVFTQCLFMQRKMDVGVFSC